MHWSRTRAPKRCRHLLWRNIWSGCREVASDRPFRFRNFSPRSEVPVIVQDVLNCCRALPRPGARVKRPEEALSKEVFLRLTPPATLPHRTTRTPP